MSFNLSFENTVALPNSEYFEEFLAKQSRRNIHELARFVEASRRNFFDAAEKYFGYNHHKLTPAELNERRNQVKIFL